MDELVKRMRAQADAERYFVGEDMLYDKAADVIEELSATISKMEKATHWMPLHAPQKEEPTCEDCQREFQMIGLDMEACASYEPPKELTGTDMRGGIRRDDAGNVVDWGITGPPGDVGKTEEE